MSRRDKNGTSDPSLRIATATELARAMNLGVEEALREHIRTGVPAVVWDRENDRVVTLPAEEIVLPDEDSRVVDASLSRDDSNP